jgi:hypothetical protein
VSDVDDLLQVMRHITAVTGDPSAWQRGLTDGEIAAAQSPIVPDSAVLADIVTKIRAAHPGLFDANTGAPVSPHSETPSPDDQRGEAAIAIKKAESDLAGQNSATALLDLMVVTAILNAHSTNAEGAAALSSLQREIDDAVRSRTDLDTPAGARDFQRFLVDKLRQIAAIVETAHLDARSKAALATAWTALYESTKGVASATADAPGAAQDIPRAEVPAPLPAYGADLPLDPFADPLAGVDLGPVPATAPAAAPAPPPATAPAPIPPITPPQVPTPSLPALPAVPNLFPAPGRPGLQPSDPLDDLMLEDLLAEPEPELEEQAADDPADGDSAEETEQEKDSTPPPPSVEVRLPDGGIVTAPSPAVAEALRAVLAGTTVSEAYHRQGITLPPPGSAVPHPVDPSRVTTGDVAMFTDHHVIAVDGQRAFVDGQVRPISAVSGPSFLGWLHPPESSSTAPSSSGPAPDPAKPAPTRPAGIGRTA